MITEVRPYKQLYLKWINKTIGWGVFTSEKIKKGETVEVCYCLLDNKQATYHKDYIFLLNRENNAAYLVLGYGSIYNHSDNPNIQSKVISFEQRFIEFFALKDIEENEELCHDYGVEYWLKRKKTKLI